MKHFTHSQSPYGSVRVKDRLYFLPDRAKGTSGQVYEIIEINNGCGGKREGRKGCVRGGDQNCPGRIKLDRPPFDRECECWSYGGESIFEFL